MSDLKHADNTVLLNGDLNKLQVFSQSCER